MTTPFIQYKIILSGTPTRSPGEKFVDTILKGARKKR